MMTLQMIEKNISSFTNLITSFNTFFRFLGVLGNLGDGRDGFCCPFKNVSGMSAGLDGFYTLKVCKRFVKPFYTLKVYN